MSAFEQKYLWPLRAEGYFVSIVSSALSQPDTYELDCVMYITDRDDFGATVLLRYFPDTDPIRDDENECIACASSGEVKREFKRGSICCPLCGDWTKPWAMKEMKQRGTFKIAPEGASFVKGCVLPPGFDEMRSEHVIHCISEALKEAYNTVGSVMAGGGIVLCRS